ncbi:MAG: arginine/lysine/histidine transport system ATP-binding protein [Thermoleophilaceae bacterium]|jgi:putative ABC transport system ATP-binding protein|nr:arginine/lysine/histidine transport system ATP-binding protein [Thermoleophilaceae bacterium]
MPLFELTSVSASRASTPVLRDLDLNIGEGATVLLGPSGAGKSTLLRLLNRLADPDSGAVRFRGEDVRELDPRALRRRACLVPQLPAPLPGTVADNVRYGPSLIGREVSPARPLELAGLSEDYAPRDATRLSVGEQQRVMLARALALEPEVLLLDEPTSALDEETRDGVERTLADLGARIGVSMVLVTHDREQARRLADRIVELRDGRIAA